jgi:hypothetical protein
MQRNMVRDRILPTENLDLDDMEEDFEDEISMFSINNTTPSNSKLNMSSR